ncbi:MAG TPA: hypothetical protein VD927_11295 [Chryseosolibacter sp.]|nr:hypothetical protein [Chryseosolibacter sp.]
MTAKLNTLFTLSELSFSANTIGQALEIQTPIYTFYGSIMKESGNKYYKPSLPGDVYNNTLNIYCRYNTIFNQPSKKKYRLSFNNTDYEIQEFTIVGRNEAIIIRCDNNR